MERKIYSRREFLAGSRAASATILLSGQVAVAVAVAAEGEKLTFTILHTNDLHSNLIGMGPASESGSWYDFTISAPGFERRSAGRMENGGNLISDPAMGT